MKTNIGHAGAAAEIAGLLKTVLAIEHSEIPPSLNYASANPDSDSEKFWAAGQHHVDALADGAGSAPPDGGVPISFRVSGTNAHVIVEQCPPLHNGVLEGSVGRAALPCRWRH